MGVPDNIQTCSYTLERCAMARNDQKIIFEASTELGAGPEPVVQRITIDL